MEFAVALEEVEQFLRSVTSNGCEKERCRQVCDAFFVGIFELSYSPSLLLPFLRIRVRELSLDSIRTFHVDLLAARQAGLELEVGPDQPQELETILVRLEQDLSIASSEQELETRLDRSSLATERYRTALNAWLATDGDAASIAPLVRSSLQRHPTYNLRVLQLIMPFIWSMIGFVVVSFVVNFLFPSYLSLAEQMRYDSAVFRALRFLYEFRSVWMLLVPILGICYLVFCLARHKKKLASSSGSDISKAYVAEQAATLVHGKRSVSESLHLASANFRAGSNVPLPPLLAWADEASTRGNAHDPKPLAFASQVYQNVAQIKRTIAYRSVVTRSAIFFGSLVALLVGVSVFLPVVELLVFASSIEGGR